MADFTMPSLGADMEAGTLVEWKIKPGDAVQRGDIVAVVETQKGAIDVEIFEAGTVEALLVEPGTTVPVGTALARLTGSDNAPTGRASGVPTPGVAAAVAHRPPSAPAPAPARPAPPGAAAARVRASPAARAAAREFGVDLHAVHGTGPSGAITREDVEQAATGAVQSADPAAGTAKPARPGSRAGMRQAIAAAMSRSKREIPHYYLATRVDMEPALGWLQARNAALKPEDRVLPLSLQLKAVALATRKVPEVNGFYERGAFRPGAGVHLGVAISLRGGGLVVPALHDVDAKPIAVLSRELADLIERARRGQLRSSELSDATLTVTSLGERGVEEVYGVIFPPQVALVGFGKIVETPSVVEGQCVPRRTVAATLSADHRASDGHRGGLFLAQVRALLQNVEAL